MIFKLDYKKETHSFRIKTKMNGMIRYITDVELQDIFFEQEKLYEDGYIDSFHCEKMLYVELLDGRYMEISMFKCVLTTDPTEEDENKVSIVIGDREVNDWVDDEIDFVTALTSRIIQLQSNIFEGTSIPVEEPVGTLDDMFVELKTIH